MAQPVSAQNQSRLSQIQMLVLDVDGVLTDTKIYFNPPDSWSRTYSIRDGWGQKALIDSGYQMAIITGSTAADIRARAQSLKIPHLYEGAADKKPAFADLLKKTKLQPEQVAYMGDDIPDIEILKQVGFACAPPEAMQEVLDAVHFVASRPGGAGAVREVCDLILKHGAQAKGRA